MSERADYLKQHISRVDGEIGRDAATKHRKMASSPFVFFRGSSQLFYADCQSSVIDLPPALLSIPLTTIMGDCHVSNFGMLTEEGSHGDKVIFAPNDFDDACIGHASWDLMRYCVSLILCQRHCKNLNDKDLSCVSSEQAISACQSFLSAYSSVCKLGLGEDDHLSLVIDRFELPSALIKGHKKARRRAAGGSQFTQKSSLAKSIDLRASKLAFRKLPDKFVDLDEATKTELTKAFSPYMDDVIIDIVARKNAGTGSVNMQRYYCLVGPEQFEGEHDLPLYHIVEVKQQRQAAPLFYFEKLSDVNRLNPAHLTAVCQRRMQRSPDLVLDEVEWQGKHWLVRSRHHARVGFDPEDIATGDINVSQGGFVEYAWQCGQALALAHCRGDRRSVRFEQAVIDILPAHVKNLIKLAIAYADQVERDCQWFAGQLS